MNVKLIAIAALGKSLQIGLKNDLPWNLPDEYQYYQQTVQGQYVIIGRKNFDSHKGDVKGTFPLILSRSPDYQPASGKAFTTLEGLLSYAKENKIEILYVIGGADIYRLTLPFLSEFLWSEVDYDGPADTFFPEFKNYPWKVMKEEKHHGWIMRKLVKTPENI